MEMCSFTFFRKALLFIMICEGTNKAYVPDFFSSSVCPPLKKIQKGSSFLQCRRQWKLQSNSPLASWWTLCNWEQRSRLTNNPAQSQFSTFWIMKSQEILDTVIDQQTLHIVVKPTNLNIQGKGHYCWRQNNFIEATLWFISQFQCGR